jgi:predicted TIM-barrel enzyme
MRTRAGGRAYGDANAIVVDMAREVLPVVRETPVLAGVCGTYVLERTTGVAGFFGASSMERLPTETAITDRVRELKEIPI